MKYNIELSDTDLVLIGEALSDMPFKKVVNLINTLQTQVTEQEAKAVAGTTEDRTAKEVKKK